MKTHFFSFEPFRHLLAAAISGLVLMGAARAQTQSPAAPPRPVTSSDSTMVKGARVYSIKFPGGNAGEFFDFLRTNGFASDNILFAGRAATIHVPPFAVRHVRLKDVAKSLELVTEGRITVEVVEKGEQSDENIWRVKASEAASPIRTKTCPMPNFFQGAKAAERISVIVKSVEEILTMELDLSGQTRERASAHTLDSERIVVVVGPQAYIEAVGSALEAAEKVAAAEAQAAKIK
jgi:hypothetical protein